MKKSVILAQSNKLGSIQRCCQGVVHVHLGGFSMRLDENVFIEFALMVEKASSRLIDIEFSELLSRQETE